MVTRAPPGHADFKGSTGTKRDPNTLSNYDRFRTTHTAVDFSVDFAKKLIGGSVALELKCVADAAQRDIVLDTSFLAIHDIKVAGRSVEWNVAGERLEPYGSALSVRLEDDVPHGQTVRLDITLSTTENCTALQWLEPAQTSNGKHPYMFSQCQAIHARSLFPCQDTPDVKSTFDFRIRSALPVVASGLVAGVEDVAGSGDKVYKFEQKVPIPSYLFAVASGDIVSADIGPRSTVWTGPGELAASKWELEDDTEDFIKIAEELVYGYAWGTYNVLVLPPSFPYGGMENPMYTFATPTIISGDRQNVDVIAHELSHSWSGNLVTNASWEHFWLNEGWTTYLERRIQMAKHGETARDFSAIIGWKALEDSVQRMGEDHEFTKLVVDLKHKDPDDAFSSVPYEKGFTFLYHLETLIGREKWDKFIPHYFNTFKFKSLDSFEFKHTLLTFFAPDAEAHRALVALDWDTWFYKPGYPLKPQFDTSMVDTCYALADRWQQLSKSSGGSDFRPAPADVASWVGNQSVVFLERLQNDSIGGSPLRAELIAEMERAYGYASSHNVELSSRFFVLGMQARAEVVYGPTAELLGKVGRMKFVRPMYRYLKECDEGLAKATFEKNKSFYHPICRGMVEKDLFGSSSK